MSQPTKSSAGRPVLTYWGVRGVAAQIRLALTTANVDFETSTITSMDEFEAAKKAADHPLFNIPMLTTVDGQHITQSGAILRHVGREHGMDGKTATERARVEEVIEMLTDFRKEVIAFVYEGMCDPLFMTERVPYYLGGLEKYMTNNGTTFAASDEVTVADCAAFTDLVGVPEVFGLPAADALAPFPALWRYYETMAAMPAVQKYLEHEDMGKLPVATWSSPDAAVKDFVRTVWMSTTS